MRDIDLLDKSLAVLVRHEQCIVVVDNEFRQPEPAPGIVQKKSVKNWLPIRIRVSTWLIIDQSTEKSTSRVTVKIGSRRHRAQLPGDQVLHQLRPRRYETCVRAKIIFDNRAIF